MGPTVSRLKQRAGERLPLEALLTCNSFRFAELGVSTSSTGGSRPVDQGRGVLGGCDGWSLPRPLQESPAQCGAAAPTLDAWPFSGGTYLNPGRGKGHSCFDAGLSSWFVPVARQRVRREISSGPEWPTAGKKLEDLEHALLGTFAHYTLFQTRLDFPILDLSLTWCLAFSKSLSSPCFILLGIGVEGGTGLPQDLAALIFLSF